MTKDLEWVVYLVRCSDHSYYTGITNHLERRIDEHNGPKAGAKYTRARQPVELVYYEICANRSEAARREYEIKQFSKSKKEALINFSNT